MTKHKKLTVAGLRELKGERQLTMLFVETSDKAAAAENRGRAGARGGRDLEAHVAHPHVGGRRLGVCDARHLAPIAEDKFQAFLKELKLGALG